MNAHAVSPTGTQNPEIQSLQAFCRATDISPITAWRWRKAGMIETLNVAGRQYITSESIAKFKRRAAAGEFAKLHVAPARTPPVFSRSTGGQFTPAAK